MKVWRLAAAVVLAHGLLAGASRAGYTSLVAFGDSLSDTGNLYAATGGAQPPAPYDQGRFSNGPVWVETLAASLGVAAPTPSLTGGTDYAWGGAETGVGMSPLGTPDLLTQVATFTAAHTLGAKDLVTIWAGGNDFFDGQTNPQVPLDNVAAAITRLAADGGKVFLVPALPLLGQVPGSAGLPQAQRDGLDSLSAAFNAGLAGKIGQLQTALGVTITTVDIPGLIQAARTDPGAYGFTNTTTGALNDGVLTGQGYLFWDNIHPTTAAHSIIASAALSGLPAAPEPSSFVLVGIAGVVVLGRLAVRRRAASA